MLTLTVGRWLVVNHKHDDYASTALTLVNVTNTTRLLGGDEVKEILVYVYVKIHVNVQSFFHGFVQLNGGEKQVC